MFMGPVAMSFGSTSQVSSVELTRVVVLPIPLKTISEPEAKSDPYTVKTNVGRWASLVSGEIDDTTGTGFGHAQKKMETAAHINTCIIFFIPSSLLKLKSDRFSPELYHF
jgi:hypothetical protein